MAGAGLGVAAGGGATGGGATVGPGMARALLIGVDEVSSFGGSGNGMATLAVIESGLAAGATGTVALGCSLAGSCVGVTTGMAAAG